MAAWHEDNAFWEDTAPVIFSEDRWHKAADDVERIVALVGLQPGATLLDMGCGPGRHTLEFARRGYRVTGVDRTANYLARAKTTADREGLDIECVKADMRRFHRDGAFDAALSLLTTFGYFQDAAEDGQVARNLLASLKPGGHLVMDLMGKEVLARIFQPRDWHEEPDGTVLLEERKITANWSWIDVCWIMMTGERRRELRFGHRVYSAVELIQLLERTGFVNVEPYGSLEATPYDHQAERLVMVARKPDPV